MSITVPTPPCPAWCAVPLGKHQEELSEHPEEVGVHHESAPVDSWVPGGEGVVSALIEPIAVSVIGFRHAQDPADDWPDQVFVTNAAADQPGVLALDAEDARRLGVALIRAAADIDGTDSRPGPAIMHAWVTARPVWWPGDPRADQDPQ